MTLDNELYADCYEIAGPPLAVGDGRVRLRPTLYGSRRRALLLLVAANAIAELCFLAWLMCPDHWRAIISQRPASSILGATALVLKQAIRAVRGFVGLPGWIWRGVSAGLGGVEGGFGWRSGVGGRGCVSREVM